MEGVNVIDAKNDEIEPSGKSTKCQKTSSDDDFVKPFSRRSKAQSKVDVDDAFKEGGTEKKFVRKSRRLQEKSATEETDKGVCF